MKKIDHNFLISPHGGTLVNRFIPNEDREFLYEKAKEYKSVILNSRQICDLEMIANGGFSPLEGFMCSNDYESVVKEIHLSNGLIWPIPITLAITKEEGKKIKEGDRITLKDKDNKLLGILNIEEKFDYDKYLEARLVYQTDDENHPGVRALFMQGDLLLGGKVGVFDKFEYKDFPEYYLTPTQTREIFRERGWKTIVGFQTRNPIHRAHEYLHKCVMESFDGLFIHPVVGDTKDDDIPADVRMKCYKAIVENYYPKSRVLLAVNPSAMRYAGPREAVLHAIVRKNYGCTHFIVGRDHAGVGNYYHTYAAHRIFETFDNNSLGITPIFFDHSFYCTKCKSIASVKTCPHDEEYHLIFSGTKVREMLRNGEDLPDEFTRPEVAQVLREWALSLNNK